MNSRIALALLAAGVAANIFATDSGALAPGTPRPTVLNFGPDPIGVKPWNWSPTQAPDLTISGATVVNPGGNRKVEFDTAGDIGIPGFTNDIVLRVGTDLTGTITARFYSDASTYTDVYLASDGTFSTNQTIHYRSDDLFNRVVISQPSADLQVDNIIVAPRCTWVGTSANNVRSGTANNDVMCGRGGNDTLFGLAGNDRIIGGSGNDNLSGGNNNDDLFGGPGLDVLVGGLNTDHCDGGQDTPDTAAGCELVLGVP